MASKFSHAVVLSALLLVGGPLAVSLFAEDEKRWEANPLQPGGSEIAFEWQYSCPNGKGCSFTCPGSGGASNVTNLASGGASNATNLGSGGPSNVVRLASGGASNVTKLAIHLGTIPLRGTEKAFGIFYEFSTMEIPRANGFSLTTGISTLSCQVSGMNLDYSGPPKDRPQANK
jgi:hypothetical protein